MPNTYLAHHGIIGQKWGVRRFQNTDGSLTAAGRSRYRNFDGSITEKGKDHRDKFVDRYTKKVSKEYDSYIKKYDKRAVKADDEEQKKYWESRKVDAEQSRAKTIDHIKNMSIEEIEKVENEDREKALKTAGKVAGAVAAGAGLLVAPSVTKALANFDPNAVIPAVEKFAQTSTGSKIANTVDATIRAYSDVRSYVILTFMDQALHRAKNSGIAEEAGKLVGDAGATAINRVGSAGTDQLLKIASAESRLTTPISGASRDVTKMMTTANESGKLTINTGNGATVSIDPATAAYVMQMLFQK